MNSILAIALLLTELCTSQLPPTTSATPAFVFTPSGCGNCELAGATATPSSFSLLSGISAATPTASYIVFTAYWITSEYSSNGFCITTSGSLIEVSPYVSVVKPASIPASVFLPTAVSSFVNVLEFSACSGGGENVTPIALTNASLLTDSLPSAKATSVQSLNSSIGAPIAGNSTEAPVPASRSHRLDEQAKIGIGIAVPVFVITLLLLALQLWRRYRKAKKANAPKEEHMIPEDNQPYLQQKAELEAEEKRKHELHAEERRYELDGESRIHEIPEESSHGMQSLHMRQELRGEEHSRELEVP